MTRLGLVSLVSVAAWLSGCSAPIVKPVPTPLSTLAPKRNLVELWGKRFGQQGQLNGALLQMTVMRDWALVADADGSVTAVAPESGKPVWSLKLDAGLTAGVGANDQLAAVVTEVPELVAINAEGKVAWRARLPASVITAPLVTERLVVVQAVDQRLYAFDASNGSRLWMVERSSPNMVVAQTGGLLALDDLIVSATAQGSLLAVNTQGGRPAWEVTLAELRSATGVESLSDVVGPLARSGDLVCARAYQWSLGCVTRRGQLQWKRAQDGNTAVAADDAYVYGASADGVVTAMQRQDGAPVWTNESLRNRALGQPALVGGMLALGDYAGYLHLLARETGEEVARLKVSEAAVSSRALLLGQTLLVRADDGRVTAAALR